MTTPEQDRREDHTPPRWVRVTAGLLAVGVPAALATYILHSISRGGS